MWGWGAQPAAKPGLHPPHCSPKPPQAPETDEDEGFGDWSQKPEPRQQCGGAQETPEDGRDPVLGKSLHGEQQQEQCKSPSPYVNSGLCPPFPSQNPEMSPRL